MNYVNCFRLSRNVVRKFILLIVYIVLYGCMVFLKVFFLDFIDWNFLVIRFWFIGGVVDWGSDERL